MANTPYTVHPLDRWTEEEHTCVLAGAVVRRGRTRRDWDGWAVAGYVALLLMALWGLVAW